MMFLFKYFKVSIAKQCYCIITQLSWVLVEDYIYKPRIQVCFKETLLKPQMYIM